MNTETATTATEATGIGTATTKSAGKHPSAAATAEARDFIAYEYRTLSVKREREALYRDSLENFGWRLESSTVGLPGSGTVTLKLKRDRMLRNRPMVAELQRKCEAALEAIESLERSKVARPQAAALLVGLVGTAFLAVSVFSFTGGLVALFLVSGFLGLAVTGGTYFLHSALRSRQLRRSAPLIDRQYDIVYASCEQAHGLLA